MKGMSQVHVARLMGLASSSQLSRFERSERNPTLKQVFQLSAILNRQVTDLYYDIFSEEREKIIKKLNIETKNK